jgi:hypothetical protein
MDIVATTERARLQSVGQERQRLSEPEAATRLAAGGRSPTPASSRFYVSIVRANVLTVFDAILAAFGAVTLLVGDARDAS